MSDSPTIILNYKLIKQTEKAFHFKSPTEDTQIWMPKSWIITYFQEEDKTVSVELFEWLAVLKGLI